MANLSFWRPLVISSIRDSIKRSPIVKDSLCHFSPMQHWSVYLTMSHESNWGPSAWKYQFVLTERLQNDLVERRLGLLSTRLRDTFHGRSEKSFDEVTWHCCKGLRSTWCSQQCYQVFNTGLKKCRNCDTSEVYRFTSDTLS